MGSLAARMFVRLRVVRPYVCLSVTSDNRWEWNEQAERSIVGLKVSHVQGVSAGCAQTFVNLVKEVAFVTNAARIGAIISHNSKPHTIVIFHHCQTFPVYKMLYTT